MPATRKKERQVLLQCFSTELKFALTVLTLTNCHVPLHHRKVVSTYRKLQSLSNVLRNDTSLERTKLF